MRHRYRLGITNPSRVEQALKARAGVVETGLFLGIAQVVLIGTDAGVDTRTRSGDLHTDVR